MSTAQANGKALEYATRLRDAGFSEIPVRTDGSKAPAVGSWMKYQGQRPTDSELRELFAGRHVGLAILGGAVSGNLEILDFDEPGLFEEFAAELESLAPGLLDRLPQVATPGQGRHVYFRCDEIEGNQKLACRFETDPNTGKPKLSTLIETRGEGGYVLAPGSPAECHSKRLPYTLVAGPSILQTPRITPEERKTLLDCARSFNLAIEEEQNNQAHHHNNHANDGLSPGDDFNARASWEGILQPHGWQWVGGRAGVAHIRRPGKTDPGWSATIGCKSASGNELLCVFSSNAFPFEGPRAGKQCSSYSKFAAYAILNHRGDYSAAAKALADQGYGNRERVDQNGQPSQKGSRTYQSDNSSTRHELSDLGNAGRFLERHGAEVRYVYAWGKWLVWDGSRWAVDDGALIEARAIETTRSIFIEASQCPDRELQNATARWALKSQEVNRPGAILKLARSAVAVNVEELDRDPWLLNCQNGTIDLRTGALRPASREDRITKVCPVTFDPEATCPRWEAFLSTIMAGNQSLIGFLQRLLGYSITGSTQEHVLAIHYGSGANGKSTTLNAILEMLGPDYGLKAPPDLLTVKKGDAHPTERACLFGRRLVVSTEGEDDHRLAEGLVKDLVSGDKISARRMREDFWTFTPTHTLHVATNHKPAVRGNDTGIWRRLKLIPFAVTIPEDQQDKSLPEKLREEYPGILAWCVRGCLDWLEHGLDEPEEVRQATAEYRSVMDVLGNFLNDCCLVGPSYKVKAAALYAAYERWAEEAGEFKQSQRRFGEALTDRGFKRFTSNGKWYEGLTTQ